MHLPPDFGALEGCVVRTWRAEYEDGSDEFATCWAAALDEFVEMQAISLLP